ncbi:hypothetical protein [Rugosimonospora africana]|uniref:Uncharacterized protein n=1 Tax=Rugosimonospora africana TaxID=556532 RepID=A0A8J3VU90_9ACTN|nr:hypothetical protein [Rugosimonospora africana]GIH19015.1 hypothetical protein Raf01_71870 [Rugosimonospora africana]
MAEIDGLTYAECLVLDPLDQNSARPLWEISEDFRGFLAGEPPTKDQLAELLGPALVSLVGYGLVEVRCFANWPSPWEEGVLVGSGRLAAESRRPEIWSRSTTRVEVLAVNITKAGIRWL